MQSRSDRPAGTCHLEQHPCPPPYPRSAEGPGFQHPEALTFMMEPHSVVGEALAVVLDPLDNFEVTMC